MQTSELRHNSSPSSRTGGSDGALETATLGSQTRRQPVKTERAEANAELNEKFEPLRVIFALTALLLGLLASLHF